MKTAKGAGKRKKASDPKHGAKVGIEGRHNSGTCEKEISENGMEIYEGLYAYGKYGKPLEDWPASEADLIELND